MSKYWQYTNKPPTRLYRPIQLKRHGSNRSLIFKLFKPVFILAIIAVATFLAIKYLQSIQHGNSKTQLVIDLPSLQNQNLTPPPVKLTSSIDPYVPAGSAMLMDVSSGYPMFAKNEHQPVAIASTTKIMTAVVTLENNSDLNKIVTVPRAAATIGGSMVYLQTGEKMTIMNLLYGMLLPSGNDAAYALALFQAHAKPGDIKPFVAMMNNEANLLGLHDTKYADPAGLNDKGHSSAYDLAVLTSYALRNPTFAKIVDTDSKTIISVDGRYAHALKNTNRLIETQNPYFYPYAIGVKTGYTDAAGHCLVSAAEKNGHKIISIILNTYYSTNTESARLSKELLQWGFANYTWPTG